MASLFSIYIWTLNLSEEEALWFPREDIFSPCPDPKPWHIPSHLLVLVCYFNEDVAFEDSGFMWVFVLTLPLPAYNPFFCAHVEDKTKALDY